jgi:hypothetical protein
MLNRYLKDTKNKITYVLQNALTGVLDSNSSAFKLFWKAVPTLRVKRSKHPLFDASSRWAGAVIHIHMILLGALIIFLKKLLHNPKALKPEFREIVRDIVFSATFATSFLACFTLWLTLLAFASVGGGEILLLSGVSLASLLLSLALIKQFRRLIGMKKQTAILALGNIPLFVLGLPWGLVAFLTISALEIVFSAFSLAKNIRFSLKETSHLLITPILVFLLVSSITGFWNYQDEVNFRESSVLLTSSVVDLGKISTGFDKTKTFFYFGDYSTINFSFSPLDANTIQSVTSEISPTLLDMEIKANQTLSLISNRDPLLMKYLSKSAEALLTGVNIVRTWLRATQLMSAMYYQRNTTSINIEKLNGYIDALSNYSIRLVQIFNDPLASLPFLNSWLQTLRADMDYYIGLCKWAITYYPSLNLDSNVSYQYNKTSDLLVVNLQLRNEGTEPIQVYPCKVGTDFEEISWMNYEQLGDTYSRCYRPSQIDFYPNSTFLMPNGSMTIVMNFKDINSSLSQYKFDLRTFIHPSIFIVFPDTYTQVNAHEMFRATIPQ